MDHRECEKERETEVDSKTVALRKWKNGVTIYWDKEDSGCKLWSQIQF